MLLVRAGRRVINLQHMIDSEDDAPESGSITLHVLPGREIVLTGEAAQELRLALLEAAPPRLVQVGLGHATS